MTPERMGKGKGMGKEAAGAAPDDESLRAQGYANKANGDLMQAGEKVQDALERD